MTAEEQQQQLAAALQLSKTGPGRQQLINTGKLDTLTALVAHNVSLRNTVCEQSSTSTVHDQQLLMLLRVLRNTCAAGTAAASILQGTKVHEHAVELAASIAKQHATIVDQEQQKEQSALLLAALQLLANMSVASADAARAVWEQLFPDKLQVILTVLQGAVHEVAALIALNCVRASSEALEDLSSTRAGTLWLQLLEPVMAASTAGASSSSSSSLQQDQEQQQSSAASTAAGANTSFSPAGNDNLCLLVKAVALRLDCLHKLLQCLQISAQDQRECSSAGADDTSRSCCNTNSTRSSSGDNSAAAGLPGFQPNMAHAVLLHIVQLEIEALPAAASTSSSDNTTFPAGQHQAPSQQQPAPPSWLQYLVWLLREMSVQASRHADSRGTVAAHVLEATLQVLKAAAATEQAGSICSPAIDIVSQLHALGLVQQLLHLLKQLGVPLKATQQAQQQQVQLQPYKGYRADLVAILSNMVHDRQIIQDDVMAAGGIEVLLNNCNLDDTAPLAREWALWSIRNMCKDNQAVQQYIAKFQAVEAVQSHELDRMGKELQLDRMTNKLTLVDKAQ